MTRPYKARKVIIYTFRQLREICKHQSGVCTCYHPVIAARYEGRSELPLCDRASDCPVWRSKKKKIDIGPGRG